MSHFKIAFLLLGVTCLAGVSACGRQLVEFGDAGTSNGIDSVAPPSVLSTLPLKGAMGVAPATTIRATFNKAMEPTSVNGLSFIVQQGGNPVGGAVRLDPTGLTATFTPTKPLGLSLAYTATLTRAMKANAGPTLDSDYSFSFTTADDALPPTVVSTVPVEGATAVSLDTSLFVTFSKAMDPNTFNALTFTVKQGATPVTGVVTLDGASNTARFVPTAALGINLVYTATVSTGCKDTGSLALPADYTFSFTTAANALPPTVLSTAPANGATAVSINTSLSAVFSKAMNPATINGSSFTLRQGSTPITGIVSLDGATNTAKLVPDAALGVGLIYTATITTSARDSGGLALAASKTWSWKTGACGQAPVALGSATGFVVLAGSTVTSTGPTLITGDLGVSPGAAITGFPPGLVFGMQHAGDPASAAGIADLTVAYNDAAGRTLCPITVSGNLGGQTLAPGLYKSTSSLEISSGDLTLDAQGDVNAVFIFQMASTFTTTAGRKVILAGGAKPANIYWQVGSSATLGSTSVMQGTVMADQAITLVTGARLTGRALARIGAVALDSNPIVKPAP